MVDEYGNLTNAPAQPFDFDDTIPNWKWVSNAYAPKPFAIGPYRIMSEFTDISEEDSNGATPDTPASLGEEVHSPFRIYRVTVWVFEQDFPKMDNASTVYGTDATDGSATGDDVKISNRYKDAAGVYTFTVRLGKSLVQFRE
jgi:hypothetical protein